MIQYAVRLIKRFTVLLPGIVIAYLSVRKIFPYFDRRLPLGFAIFVTYTLGAYVLIPALIRIIRAIKPANHLPFYSVTPDGFASDPVNIGIMATRRELITAMEQSGWHMADPHSLRNTIREALSAIYGWNYPNAPVSSLYLFGRKQDVAFEIPVEGVTGGGRHHVRFWATTFQDKERLTVRSIHWHHRRSHSHAQGANLLWVGAASLDVGIGFIRHNLQITHMIDPDTNQERDLIVEQLRECKLVKKVDVIELGQPYSLINRVMNGRLHTDGKMSIVYLKPGKRD